MGSQKYRDLTNTNRILIEYELEQNSSIRAISRKLDISKSTIADEIKKKTGYLYMLGDADKITRQRLKARETKLSAIQHLDLLEYINKNYDRRDNFLKLLRLEWKHEDSEAPSLATLYNWLSKGIFEFDYNSIPKPHKKRHKTIAQWKEMVGTPITLREQDFLNFQKRSRSLGGRFACW